jgi:hypothetical protein
MSAANGKTATVADATANRFRISVHGNGYYQVSIPEYGGGEVVRAEAYDALVAERDALREVAERVRDWYEGRIPNLPADRTALYEKARAALSLARGEQNGLRTPNEE